MSRGKNDKDEEDQLTNCRFRHYLGPWEVRSAQAELLRIHEMCTRAAVLPKSQEKAKHEAHKGKTEGHKDFFVTLMFPS